MIKKDDFQKINSEVKDAVKQVFGYIKQHEKDKNDYYLFLCNATYIEQFKDNSNISPYILDYRSDIRKDRDRVERFLSYLNKHYAFSQAETVDDTESLTQEMMIYTHLWESKTFLKQLAQLSNLCNGDEYDWDISIPEYTRKEFIKKIISKFNNSELAIAEIINLAYNSQIRNAFAHSDFSFSRDNKLIELNNYREKHKDKMIRSISIDDWTKKFCYSFLIGYFLLQYIHEEIQNISGQFIEVNLRNRKGEKRKGLMVYDKERNCFSGRIIEDSIIPTILPSSLVQYSCRPNLLRWQRHPSDPYRISTKADMEALAAAVEDGTNKGYEGKYFKLQNSLTGSNLTTSIGDYTNRYYVNGSAVSSTDANGKDGANALMADFRSQSWIQTNLGWDFGAVWQMSVSWSVTQGLPVFKPQQSTLTYTITATAGSGGSISPTGFPYR